MIAASIVEKEGYYPVNMPKVARVIYNRLARGGPLQMDATVLYYLGKDGGTVTPAMLQTQEPYNTYLNTGLTPTPICAVSTIALRATLHPPVGTWLYFTLINEDGQMAFSTTFAQQLKEEKIGRVAGDRMKWRLGVAGSPIEHSLTPQLHDAALAMAGLEGSSRRVELGAKDKTKLNKVMRKEFDAPVDHDAAQGIRRRDLRRARRRGDAHAVGQLAPDARRQTPGRLDRR